MVVSRSSVFPLLLFWAWSAIDASPCVCACVAGLNLGVAFVGHRGRRGEGEGKRGGGGGGSEEGEEAQRGAEKERGRERGCLDELPQRSKQEKETKAPLCVLRRREAERQNKTRARTRRRARLYSSTLFLLKRRRRSLRWKEGQLCARGLRALSRDDALGLQRGQLRRGGKGNLSNSLWSINRSEERAKECPTRGSAARVSV